MCLLSATFGKSDEIQLCSYPLHRYLLAEKQFNRIVIFEQRNNVGGTWNYTPDDDLAKTQARSQSIPQTSPHAALERPIWRSKATGSLLKGNYEKEATFASALYDDLESNIPKELMEYPDYPFKKDLQLFPGRQEVLRYLEAYAQDVQHLIRFQTQVYDVQKPVGSPWIVSFRNLETGKEAKEPYDAVLVVNGHYDVPHIPAIRGLEQWREQSPETLSHSKFYRRPDKYKNKVQ